jgi:hypothetical protein
MIGIIKKKKAHSKYERREAQVITCAEGGMGVFFFACIFVRYVAVKKSLLT